tara:strand:+ start:6516 stop:7067 length:552 start_codon:yes stop_codon:yes gene_type:complete
MDKKTRNLVIILIVIAILYFVSKYMRRTRLYEQTTPNPNDSYNQQPSVVYYGDGYADGYATIRSTQNALSGQCVNPAFKDLDLSGRECAGRVINENKTLKLGDQSCEVLLLQQRLNAMQSDKYILKPTGKFDCHTKFKLNMLMGVPQISLNMFSPDEQIGFNELEGGRKITPYSYMDINNKIN